MGPMSFLQWLFEDESSKPGKDEADRMPESTHEEYVLFLTYMRQGRRRFQTAGSTIHQEFAAWLKHHRRRVPATAHQADEVTA